MANFDKTKNETLARCREKRTLVHHEWECKLVQPLWKTVWRFLKKLKIEMPYNSAIPLVGIYLKEMRTLIWRDMCTPTFIAALFTIAQIWKQPKCWGIDECIKTWCDICNGIVYYSAIKGVKCCHLRWHGWSYLEGIMLSEIS